MVFITPRTYRTTEKQNLKVIKASKKQNCSESEVIRRLIDKHL